VLRNPDMERLSFFYFRSPETSNQVEKELSKKPDYRRETEASYSKLKFLKEEILKHEIKYPVPVRKNYPDTKTLGQLVLDDLWNVIDKKFPIEKVPTPLERERIEHEAFALARTKVYIGREEYFKRINEHVKGNDLPLVLLGDSGSGKSALISKWVEGYREKHPEEFMVMHFIGSTPDSADYVRLLRRIMEEIKERYPEEKDEIPTDPKKVVEAFSLWLAKASARGRFILILDALNQLEDRDNAPDLGWLPEYFPPNIRVILSTLSGRSLEALRKRNYQTLPVQPIEINERKEFIERYLEQYRKKLSKPHTGHIASASQSANPLYLRTLLEELRVFGIYEELENRINHYLKAKTVDDLFELVLERLEKDYDRDRPGLVRDAMSLLWASRRGLSEAEILGLLGSQDEPLPRAYWSPLYLALEASLVSRSGFLNFFHDFLRMAVNDRYLQTEEQKRASHLHLADYFEKRELDERKVDELPWQLLQVESWERLKDCITDMDMFLKLRTDIKQYELMDYWLSIGNRFDMVEAYNTMINRYGRTSPSEDALTYRLNEVAFFLNLNAIYEGAEPLYRRALAIHEKVLGREHPNTITIRKNLEALKQAVQGKGRTHATPKSVSLLEKFKKFFKRE
jgi:nephrocystin-3